MQYPTYDPQSALTPLTADELDGLDRLLEHLPADAAMTLDGVDGYLTALLVAPGGWFRAQATGLWLPPIWGGDPEEDSEHVEPFASKRQRKATVVLILRHLRHIGEQLQHPQRWEPIFSVAEDGEDASVDARDWCAGFLQAVDLAPDVWAPVWQHETIGPAMAPLLRLGGGLDGSDDTSEALEDPALCDELSRVVPEAVLMLRQEHTRQP